MKGAGTKEFWKVFLTETDGVATGHWRKSAFIKKGGKGDKSSTLSFHWGPQCGAHDGPHVSKDISFILSADSNANLF